MRFQHLCSLLLVLLTLTCCTRAPADQLKSELQTVSSWTATARMTGEMWLKDNVPHAYASQTLRMAAESLQEELKTIDEQQAASASTLSSTLAAKARELMQLIEQMRAAVENRDKSSVAQLLKQLEAEEQAVKAMSEEGGAKP